MVYTRLGLLQHECYGHLVTRETLAGPSVSYDPVCFQSFTDLSRFGVISVLPTVSVSTEDDNSCRCARVCLSAAGA